MAWWTGLGAKLTSALSRGLDLVFSRLLTVQGSLSALELEIQRRVPDIPAPAAAALLAHVARAAEAAAAMRSDFDKVFDKPEMIPVNELVAQRYDPTDRFVYVVTATATDGTEQVSPPIAIDIASPIALSGAEVSAIAGKEGEGRMQRSPKPLNPKDLDLGQFEIIVDINGVFRVY